MRHKQRGQVLPIWIVGIIGTIALMVTALNYGNALRYHIRAQNAADSAAQAVLAIQSSRWNEMMEVLYGMNVEEYRIRQLLNGLLLGSSYSAGCYQNGSPPTFGPAANEPVYSSPNAACELVYDNLRVQYIRAVNRYSKELELLNQISTNATYTNWQQDANTLMNHLYDPKYCNNVNQAGGYDNNGGDCKFIYSWASTPLTRSQANTGLGLSTVYADGTEIIIPSFGRSTTYGTDTENQQLFAPAQVDVVTCVLVQPLIPAFLPGLNPKPYYAVGRASATNVMFVEDWFEPGGLNNPATTQADGFQQRFQPQEYYGTPAAPTAQHDFYQVDFGGNGAIDNTNVGAFGSPTDNDEMSVRLGWWNSIPIHPTNINGVAPNLGSSQTCPQAGS